MAMSLSTDISEMIRNGASLAQLSRKLGSRPAAMDAYVQAQSKTFGANRAISICSECGATADVRRLRCTWTGVHHPLYLAPIALMGVLVGVHYIPGRAWKLITYHPMCGACVRRFYLTRAFAVALEVIGLLLVAAGGIVTVAWVMPLLFLISGIEDPRQIHMWGVRGVIALVAGIVLLRYRSWLTLPNELAAVRRRPFELKLARQVGAAEFSK